MAMAAPSWRRQLPFAPDVDTSITSNVIIQRCIKMDERQNVVTGVGKKRLTPEVVAMLLTLDCDIDKSMKEKRQSITSSKNNNSTYVCKTLTKVDCNVGIVNIVKISGQPLGFSLREYNVNKGERPGGIFVSRLTPGGVVEQNSLLSIGDEILEINSVPVNDYKLSDVVAMIQIPKKLSLRVRFGHEGLSNDKDIGETNSNFTCVKKINKSDNHDNQELNTQASLPGESGFLQFRRSSSGRMLPDLPAGLQHSEHLEIDNERMTRIDTNKFFNSKVSHRTQLNQKNDSKTSKYQQLNPNGIYPFNGSINLKNFPVRATNQRRSTGDITLVDTVGNSLQNDVQDGVNVSRRLDPSDVKFDIISSNNPKVNSTSKISHSINEIKIEAKQNWFKESESFGSSSSLSSSESPIVRSSNHKTSIGALSRSEMLTVSSQLSDNSPVSSSTENEDHNCNVILRKEKVEHEKHSFFHPLSSDDIRESNNNSWFSKISYQKRKQVRKFSEGSRALSKALTGDPYRVHEPKDISSDDAEHGYRLYPGIPQESQPRAVSGMLTLAIIKGAQLGDFSGKEKRKKTKVFCSIESDGVKQASTLAKKGGNDFEWNDSFEIELQRSRELCVNVYTRFKKNDTKIAEGTLSLASLHNEGNEHCLAVCLEPFGLLCIKLSFTDMKFMLQRTPSQKKEGVFGFPLETVLRREGSKIPNLIRKCVEEINARGLETTGIYRICGNAAKKKALRAQFDNDSSNVNLNSTENPVDVNIITGLLKDYLRELPQPLLSQDIRELLISQDVDTLSETVLSQIVDIFPRFSKATIKYLFDHFSTVLMNSEVNKMDSHNLAVCIGPVLLCPSLSLSTVSTVNDTKKDINAIRLLLEVWPKPEQVSAC